jgi:RNA polymerase sigma-70 factor, ECF subfamily
MTSIAPAPEEGSVPAGRRRLDPQQAAAHMPRLRRLARAVCPTPHIADDAVQETYVRILARPRYLHGDDDYSYLARTLRNVVANHMAGENRRRPAVDLDEFEPPDARGSADPEARLLAGEVYGVIANLPEEKRDVIAAVDVAGLSYAEAAESLRLPIGTVMSRLHRGRGEVAEALAA